MNFRTRVWLIAPTLALSSLSYAQTIPSAADQYWIGDSVTGETLTIEEFGIPAPEQQIRIQLRGGPPNFLAGLIVNPAPLDEEVIPPIELSSPIAITAATDAMGFASVPLVVPPGLPAGTALDFQWATLDLATGAIVYSEVLRVRTIDSAKALHVGYDVDVAVTLEGGFGGDAAFPLSGMVSMDLTPGPASGTMTVSVADISLSGDGGAMGAGVDAGLVTVRLATDVSAIVTFQERYDFTTPATLEVWYEGLSLDEDHPEWIPGDVEDTPRPLFIEGVLSLQHDVTGGNDGQLIFIPNLVQPDPAFGTFVTIDGTYTAETLPYEVSDKVKKKLMKVCVVIIRDSNGANPACSAATAAARIAEADRLFCEQCCIRIQQDGPTRFVDNTNFQDMNFQERTAFINAHNTPCIELVFTSSVTSPSGNPTGVTRGGKSNDPTVFVGNQGNLNTTAHELGHALGLDHRGTGLELMQPVADPAKHKLNKDECDKARGKTGLECLDEECEPQPQG
ncbi:MAG: hypothetical protein R3F49_14465 [Planctomycetota bacterium]